MGKLSQFDLPRQDEKEKKVSEDELRGKYEQYSSMSNDELNSELLREVGRQKMAGTFNYGALEKAVESLKESLPEENYNNIKRLLEGLKWFYKR